MKNSTLSCSGIEKWNPLSDLHLIKFQRENPFAERITNSPFGFREIILPLSIARYRIFKNRHP